MNGPRPVSALNELAGYRSSRSLINTPIRLDGNEGRVPPASVLAAVERAGVEILRRYPNKAPLEAKLASRYGIAPAQLIVTNGADDALDRIARSFVGAGRSLVAPGPTFEMIERFVRISGGEFIEVPWWSEPLPSDAIGRAVQGSTSVIAVVTPNNPTGLSASLEQLESLAERFRDRLLVVDLAYAEFADADVTGPLLGHPNVIITRTLSKAWSLAGVRVGYALSGNLELVEHLRNAGGPYPVAGPSLAIAEAWLDLGDEHVAQSRAAVSVERATLGDLLNKLGAEPFASQANFVCARFSDVNWVHDCVASLGIAIRAFADKPKLSNCARITCPQDPEILARLLVGLEAALSPSGIIVQPGSVERSALVRLREHAAVDECDLPKVAGPKWWLGKDAFDDARSAGFVNFAIGTTDETAQAAGAARGFTSIDDVIRAWHEEGHGQ